MHLSTILFYCKYLCSQNTLYWVNAKSNIVVCQNTVPFGWQGSFHVRNITSSRLSTFVQWGGLTHSGTSCLVVALFISLKSFPCLFHVASLYSYVTWGSRFLSTRKMFNKRLLSTYMLNILDFYLVISNSIWLNFRFVNPSPHSINFAL